MLFDFLCGEECLRETPSSVRMEVAQPALGAPTQISLG